MTERPGMILTTPLPKAIAACLDFLPHRRVWAEDEFVEWLAMFESACRVWYRLPRPPQRPEDPRHDG